jgi:hypothetical protein
MLKAELKPILHSSGFEILLLFVMLLTLVIPSATDPITSWTDIPSLLFVRAIIWFFGLVLLPGLCIMKLTGIMEGISKIMLVPIAANFSLVFVGLIALVLYHVQGNVVFLPHAILVIVGALVFLRWVRLKQRINGSIAKLTPSRWNLILTFSLLASVLISLMVQIGQKYLIPGDIWVSLQPSVEILSARNVFFAFSGHEYPLIFGFILSALSICSGMPSVNTYVLLFPLVLLNMLSFYTLTKVVFQMDQKIATIATIIYGLTGGLGYLFQILIYHGTEGFWSVSHLTYDMYFTVSFWNNIEFSYKSLALTLVYSSMVIFVLSMRFKNILRKFVGILLVALMLIFSFSIHMVEPLILSPAILILAFLHEESWSHRLKNLGITIIGIVSLFLLIDYLTDGYYSWLILRKTELFFSTLNIEVTFSNISYSLILISLGLVVSQSFFVILRGIPNLKKKILKNAKRLIVIALLSIYTTGLCFWFNAPTSEKPLYDVNQFPWYYHTTRYGFIGFLAIIGLGLTNWKAKWFAITVVWCFAPLLIGSFWWGYRLTSYVYPVVALFAAISLCVILEKSRLFLCTYLADQNRISPNRIFKVRLRPLLSILVGTLLVLSFSSVIYGAAYYASSGPCLNNDDIKVLLWLHKNTPEDSTIMVPEVYRLSKGVETISDRRTYLDSNLPIAVDATSFTNLTQTIYIHNIQYILTTESINQQNYLLDLLLTYSNLTYESGENRIFKLPHLTPPTPYSNIAIIDRETLGLPDTTNFAWFDDSFAANWTYKNVNITTDGEVLTCKWNFQADNTQEPSMKTKLLPTDTNTYSYLIIGYRNTRETTTTAEDNVGQIVTLINSTGYAKGFFKNVYLPISKQDACSIFVTKLPENQEVAEIWIWMRNYEKLNGTIGLQIDFIGLSSVKDIPENPINIRFITSAIPAMWQTNYSIFQEFDQSRTAKTIVTSYSKDISDKILEQSDSNIFVLFNRTIILPEWGIEWQSVDSNIITGYLNSKKIILCRTENINQENIAVVAENIYQQIRD